MVKQATRSTLPDDAFERRDEYLARAEYAEAIAARVTDPSIKTGWETVAQCYRSLAQIQVPRCG